MTAFTPLERAAFMARSMTPGFARLVAQSRALIADWLPRTTKPYIAVSGGKDSTVMAHLVWEADPSVPAIHIDTQCDYPETQPLLDALRAEGRIVYSWPALEPYLETLQKAGLDNPRLDDITMESSTWYPCRTLRATHGYDGVAVGIRAEEAPGRAKLLRFRGPLFHRVDYDQWQVCPLARWSTVDIWAAIVAWQLPYNGAYDRMGQRPLKHRRVSVWAGETFRSHGRYVWLRREYPELWNRLLVALPEVAEWA